MSAQLKRPSELTSEECGAWADFMAATPHLQRAFFTPAFARAAETAHGRARVLVLREGGQPVAFLAFQYASRWHQQMGLAERIGGELCDNAGIVARPGFVTTPAALLAAARLNGLFLTHLAEGQEVFGLVAETAQIGHEIDLADGPEAYFAALRVTGRAFLNDTERRLRRIAKDYGALEFSLTRRPDPRAVLALIEVKRAQYARTHAADPFAVPGPLIVLRTLADAPDPDCEPVLTTLAAGGQVLAQHLGLLHQGCLSYWFPVYDPAAQKVSPGRMLLWHTIHAADTHGIRLIDRGEGDSQAKRDFSTGTRRFGRANWRAPGLRGLVARAGQGIAWRAGL